MDIQQQVKAIKHITAYFDHCAKRQEQWKEERLKIYKELSTLEQVKQSNWSGAYKVNKMAETREKITPRIVAKNPRWIVSATDVSNFPDNEEIIAKQEELKLAESTGDVDTAAKLKYDIVTIKRKMASEWAKACQDYLTYIWVEYKQTKHARRAAKAMISYGKTYMKVKYRYEKVSLSKMTPNGEVSTEEVIGEYPTIDVRSWANLYYDPAYIEMNERPALIEIVDNLRYADLLRAKDQYINLDKIKDIADAGREQSSTDYQSRVREILGIQDESFVVKEINLGKLHLKMYYGWYSVTGEAKDEKMSKIIVVNDMVVIKYEEIKRMPFVEAKCFEDTETAFAAGFLERIMGLQQEDNYKRNAASEYINKSLTRQAIWSPNSGIDPRTINDPIIVSSEPVATALANFQELPHREINTSYFQERNDLERQYQAATFTVDTAQPTSQQALTNTATGIRVKFFESNSVINEVRKHWEEALEELGYLFLQEAFDNLDDNIVFKKTGTEDYWQMNKEMLRDAVLRYSIKIETNSSSFDDFESRREDAVAFFNLLVQAKAAGANVDLDKGLEDALATFEKKDPKMYMGSPNIQQTLAGAGLVPQPAPEGDEAAQTTQQVAGGQITA